MLSVNKIFLAPAIYSYSTKMSKITGSNILFFKIAGAKAPMCYLNSKTAGMLFLDGRTVLKSEVLHKQHGTKHELRTHEG